jgi:hypothetical protein
VGGGDAPETLTQQTAAARLEISPAWLRELTLRGSISRNPDGTYPWPTIRDDHERYKAAGQSQGAEVDALRAEQIRLTREKADAAELENAKLCGSLIDVGDALANLERVLLALDAKLRSAKRRRGPGLAKKLGVSAAQAMALVEVVTEEVRGELRQELERLASTEATDATA